MPSFPLYYIASLGNCIKRNEWKCCTVSMCKCKCILHNFAPCNSIQKFKKYFSTRWKWFFLINSDELGKRTKKMKQREKKSWTNLYNGMPASSRNHSTIYTLSRDGGISGHGSEIRFPSTACTSMVRTAEKMTQKRKHMSALESLKYEYLHV